VKIFTIAEQEPVAIVMSIDEMVDNLSRIKELDLNVISIRDSESGRSEQMRQAYATIDSAGLGNLYVEIFDDLAEPFEQKMGLVFPQSEHVSGILDWAKQKWEENGKRFVVHCTGGVSRSSAIAMLINQMIMNDYRAGWDIKLHSPNHKVLEYGEQHLGVEPFKDIVQQETKEYDKKRFEEEDYNPF